MLDIIFVIMFFTSFIVSLTSICLMLILNIKIKRQKENQLENNYLIITDLINRLTNQINDNVSFYEAQKTYIMIKRLLDNKRFFLPFEDEIYDNFSDLTNKLVNLELKR